jgi:hypothetical protein
MEPDGRGGLTKQRKKFGEVSEEGLIHFISNCAFEPVSKNDNVVSDTLKQVAAAFRWGKPALINTHRINFVKGRNSDHVDRCLNLFSDLLGELTDRWPDLEFMGAGDFARYLNSTLEIEEPKRVLQP